MQRSLLATILLFASAQACTTAGGCGSQSGSKIPGGISREYVQNDVVQTRISPSGFAYIENNLVGVITAALGHPLTYTLPTTTVANVTFCSGGGCNATFGITPGSLKIIRQAPDGSGKSRVEIDADVSIEIDNIYNDTADVGVGDDCRVDLRYMNHYADACTGAGTSFGGAIGPSCDAFCNTSQAADARTVKFAASIGVDPVLGYPTVTVDETSLPLQDSNGCSAIEDIRAIQPNHAVPVCNHSSDASNNDGDCCDATDAACISYYQSVLNSASLTCVGSEIANDLAAGFADFIGTAATFAINQQLSAILTQPCQSDLDCEQGLSCNTVQTAGGFPVGCSGAGCLLPPLSSSVCNSGGNAVPPLAGMEAQEDVASLAEAGGTIPNGALFGTAGGLQFIAGVGGDIGNDSDADIAARGATASDDERGLTIAGFVGINSAQTNCAPPQARPLPIGHQPLQMPDQITLFDSAQKKTMTEDYAAAISLSRDALNQLAWGLYTNGDMCLTFAGTKTLKLNSQLLALLVSTLGQLENNQNEPAFINVFPEEVPQFSAGAGELAYAADGTPSVVSPHLQISVNKLNMEFYAFVEDRYVRLFTIKVDFTAGVFFDFDDKGNLLPVVSDLSQGIGQVTVTNVDILGEKADSLQQLLPALLSFALPEVTAALLKPMPLPFTKLVPGYAFEVVGIHGMSQLAGTDSYDYLSIFGAMSTASVAHDAPSGTVEFSLGAPRVDVPAGALLEAATSPVLHVPTNDAALEYSYRLDGSMWSPFANVKELSVSRPILRIATTHTLDVRARRVGDRRSLSAIQTVSFDVQDQTTIAAQDNSAPAHAQGCHAAGQEVAWLVSLALLALWHRRRASGR